MRLSLVLVALLCVTSSVLGGEFPDGWYYQAADRPAKLRAMEMKPPPKLTLKDWIGDAVDLEKLEGKVVVIDFWATWCGPCMKALPKNVKLSRKYKKQGVVFLGVHDARNGAEKMPALAKARGIDYPLAVDDQGKSTKAWNIQFWPTYFIIDRQGVVRAAGLKPAHVEQVLMRLVKEGEAKKPSGKGDSGP